MANADNEVLLDKIVYYFLDQIRNVYPTAPYITRVPLSKDKHIHFTLKKYTEVIRREDNSICIEVSRNRSMMLNLKIVTTFFYKKYYPRVTLVGEEN